MADEDDKPDAIVVSNPWAALRAVTAARIALGRSGTSLPTRPHLQFQLAHAKARSAVHHALDAAALAARLAERGEETLLLSSEAGDRTTYLQRPDAGRRLDAASAALLRERSAEPFDVAIVVGDGLSALAIEENAAPFLDAFLPALDANGWSRGPIAIVRQARVAVGDEIGTALGARMSIVLIGERPGLSSPDSLGLYMTFAPRIGLTDEARNCISNVREAGLSPVRAASKLVYLVREAFARGLSGVGLKDEEAPSGAIAPGDGTNFLTRRSVPDR